MRIKGVIGRVLIKNAANHLLIQVGDGLLWLTDYEIIDYNNESSIPDIKVGERIGYNVEYEIYKIKKLISNE